MSAKRKWLLSPDYSLGVEWQYVDDGTQEVVASVTRYGRSATWKAWVRGAAFGEFLTLEAAKNKAEKSA